MATTVGNILRLSRAGLVLAQHGVRFVPAGTKPPFALCTSHARLTLPIRVLTWPFRARQPKEQPRCRARWRASGPATSSSASSSPPAPT